MVFEPSLGVCPTRGARILGARLGVPGCPGGSLSSCGSLLAGLICFVLDTADARRDGDRGLSGGESDFSISTSPGSLG
jgi:hypothetical protein